MQEILKWSAEHYKTGLLTNIMPGTLDLLLSQEILPSLEYDAIIDSSAVGFLKPEAEIYEVAQAHSGFPPEEILLIDDSRANLIAAEKLGWHVLWYDDSLSQESAERVRQALTPAE